MTDTPKTIPANEDFCAAAASAGADPIDRVMASVTDKMISDEMRLVEIFTSHPELMQKYTKYNAAPEELAHAMLVIG